MAYAISVGAYYHWIKRIEATPPSDGVLKLTLHGDPDATPDQNNSAEILIFMEDQALVDRLVKAINGAAE